MTYYVGYAAMILALWVLGMAGINALYRWMGNQEGEKDNG